MKLSSAMAVGVLTVLTVVSLPMRLDEGAISNLQQLDVRATTAAPETHPAAALNSKTSVKRPQRLTELNLNQLLGQLQKKVAVSAAAAPVVEVQPQAPVTRKMRGIKRVEAESLETSGQDYAIPNGDIFLDRSAVGEAAPADATVR